MNIQIFGQIELEEYINNGGKIYSHLISIGNPKSFGVQRNDTFLPDLFKSSFKKILRLNFYDVESKNQLRKNQIIKKIVKYSDINKVIKYYNTTKNEATGYTIHCWEGISRSTAIGLGLLYLIYGDEEIALNKLKKIRPQALPNQLLVKLFDEILGCDLTKQNNKIIK